jgi:hypothetical protein
MANTTSIEIAATISAVDQVEREEGGEHARTSETTEAGGDRLTGRQRDVGLLEGGVDGAEQTALPTSSSARRVKRPRSAVCAGNGFFSSWRSRRP